MVNLIFLSAVVFCASFVSGFRTFSQCYLKQSSRSQDYSHPDDRTSLSYDMTPGFKPFYDFTQLCDWLLFHLQSRYVCRVLTSISSRRFFQAVFGQHVSCERSMYYKLGCYQDRRWTRAMSQLLITDRDPKSSKYGMQVDWQNWEKYLQGLACRCAQAASSLGYTMFGLQNYGECWSGANACDQYSRHGDSYMCIDRNYTMCNINDDNECIGKGDANFVYMLLEETE